jgi:hypothetical protein
MSNIKDIKLRIIRAGEIAVEELIKIAKEPIVNVDDETPSLAADRLKNAAATKKLAILDAFDILNKIESEREMLNSPSESNVKIDSKQGFAERRSR